MAVFLCSALTVIAYSAYSADCQHIVPMHIADLVSGVPVLSADLKR